MYDITNTAMWYMVSLCIFDNVILVDVDRGVCVNNSTFVYTLWISSQDVLYRIKLMHMQCFIALHVLVMKLYAFNLKVILNHVHSNSTVVNINVNKLHVIIMAPLTKHILVR